MKKKCEGCFSCIAPCGRSKKGDQMNNCAVCNEPNPDIVAHCGVCQLDFVINEEYKKLHTRIDELEKDKQVIEMLYRRHSDLAVYFAEKLEKADTVVALASSQMVAWNEDLCSHEEYKDLIEWRMFLKTAIKDYLKGPNE